MTSPAQRRDFERRFGFAFPAGRAEGPPVLPEERRHNTKLEAEYARPASNDCETDGQRRRRMALSGFKG